MSLIKNIFINSFLVFFLSSSLALSEELKKIGKFKDWEVIVVSEASGKVCFAQSIPVLQAPKKN